MHRTRKSDAASDRVIGGAEKESTTACGSEQRPQQPAVPTDGYREVERRVRLRLVGRVAVVVTTCILGMRFMESNKLPYFAARYTAAWCSQNAASVASFFEEKGSLKINEGAPAVGRTAITDAVQGFMTAFPDLVVKMDSVSIADMTYHWTLTGTNTGPGGTGVRPHEQTGIHSTLRTRGGVASL